MPSFSRQAVLRWNGDTVHGAGEVSGGSSGFTMPATYPRVAGEPTGHTTPEEMLAASHAACFGIGLRGLIAQRGGRARQVEVTATITADKGADGIRIRSSHLQSRVHGLEGIGPDALQALAKETEERCTISVAIRGSVAISMEVAALA